MPCAAPRALHSSPVASRTYSELWKHPREGAVVVAVLVALGGDSKLSDAFLQRNIVLVLKRAAEQLSPKEIHDRVFFRWRKPSRANVRNALTSLRDKGCVICFGSTRDRKCEATSVRPVDMRGKSAGSAVGLAMGSEQHRQASYRACGVVPTGTALERAWPMMFGQHPETEEDE